MFSIERYQKTRFWALHEDGELLCVTVYKKGAQAVMERLERRIDTVFVSEHPKPSGSSRMDTRLT